MIPPDAAKICRPSVAPMRVMMAGTAVPTVMAFELLSCDISHAVSASRGWWMGEIRGGYAMVGSAGVRASGRAKNKMKKNNDVCV